ncbi:MAG: tRNA (adenosine(37)-N6)-threonylcarbamoyltransferase complex transferase subunit TsaD, partial [Acidimicrobiales bacterium]
NHSDVGISDVAASFQAAVADVLVAKAMRAVEATGAPTVALGGGVAANSLLRARMVEAADQAGVACFVPSREMCTDNAAMVAAAGWWRLRADGPTPLDAGASPNLRLA